MSLSPHERNQSLQWDIGKLPTQTQEEEAPGGLCQHRLQHGYFFTTQTHIACRVWGGGWTPRSKSNHISQFFQSAKKLYKHREASPFLNSGKRLPRMFYNAQFSFLFYFFSYSNSITSVSGVFLKRKEDTKSLWALENSFYVSFKILTKAV